MASVRETTDPRWARVDEYAARTLLKPDAALARTTHLCIAAHKDDIEIMAYHGIAQCFGSREQWFTGVVVTNGAGSPRTGIYGAYTDEEMHNVLAYLETLK